MENRIPTTCRVMQGLLRELPETARDRNRAGKRFEGGKASGNETNWIW